MALSLQRWAQLWLGLCLAVHYQLLFPIMPRMSGNYIEANMKKKQCKVTSGAVLCTYVTKRLFYINQSSKSVSCLKTVNSPQLTSNKLIVILWNSSCCNYSYYYKSTLWLSFIPLRLLPFTNPPLCLHVVAWVYLICILKTHNSLPHCLQWTETDPW